MKIMIIQTPEIIGDVYVVPKKDPEIEEFKKQLNPENVIIYDNMTNIYKIEEDQKLFDCIYCKDPKLLINLKLKIPYFYNIPTNYISNEMHFNHFNNFYSQLKGAKAVFVSEKKLNKYSEWLNLNPYWIPEPVDIKSFKYTNRKFYTPKLDVLVIPNDSATNYLELKNNIYIQELKNKEDYSKFHVIIDTSIDFPSKNIAEAMACGCVPIALNPNGNNSNIIFDKVHYYKIDPLENIMDTLFYVEKRREKLERMSLSASQLIGKYFDIKDIVTRKIEIIKKYS